MSETTATVAAEAPASAPAAAPADATAAAPAEATSLLGAAAAEAPASAEDAAKEPEAAKAPEAPAVPETYDLKFPEGSTVDAGMLAGYQGALKEAGLTQAQAEKLTPFLSSQMQALRAEASKAWTDLQSSWVSEIRADPEIGGAKLAPALADAAKAIDRFGGSALRQALTTTGAGNNPSIVRAFAAIGKAIAEDSRLPTGRAPSGDRDNTLNGIASRLYGAR